MIYIIINYLKKNKFKAFYDDAKSNAKVGSNNKNSKKNENINKYPERLKSTDLMDKSDSDLAEYFDKKVNYKKGHSIFNLDRKYQRDPADVPLFFGGRDKSEETRAVLKERLKKQGFSEEYAEKAIQEAGHGPDKTTILTGDTYKHHDSFIAHHEVGHATEGGEKEAEQGLWNYAHHGDTYDGDITEKTRRTIEGRKKNKAIQWAREDHLKKSINNIDSGHDYFDLLEEARADYNASKTSNLPFNNTIQQIHAHQMDPIFARDVNSAKLNGLSDADIKGLLQDKEDSGVRYYLAKHGISKKELEEFLHKKEGKKSKIERQSTSRGNNSSSSTSRESNNSSSTNRGNSSSSSTNRGNSSSSSTSRESNNSSSTSRGNSSSSSTNRGNNNSSSTSRGNNSSSSTNRGNSSSSSTSRGNSSSSSTSRGNSSSSSHNHDGDGAYLLGIGAMAAPVIGAGAYGLNKFINGTEENKKLKRTQI